MCVVLLQLLAGTGVAQAASAACEAIKLIGTTTNETRTFAQGAFLPGESLTVSFSDSGENIGNLPTSADAIIFRSSNFAQVGYDYRSNTGSAGAHTATIASSFLAANALFMSIKTGRYIPCRTTAAAGAAGDAAVHRRQRSGFQPGRQRRHPALQLRHQHWHLARRAGA